MGILIRVSSNGGALNLLSVALVVLGLSASVFAIDLPVYFNARNQLQTSVDAAALAGAASLPVSTAKAQADAYQVAALNPIGKISIQPTDLSYISTQSKFTVTGKVEVPTFVGKLLCAFSGKMGTHFDDGTGTTTGATGTTSTGTATVSTQGCNTMTVVASSSAAPAARDTILVIDTSSSMDDLGHNRPLADVEAAANNYIATIAALNNTSVDRIALVTFNQTGTLQVPLTAQTDSPGFAKVKSAVSSIRLFSGIGWNTNYEAGLHTALDEMQKNGRQNAEKTIIFMTDGMPNLPAPASYYLYNKNEPYRKCSDSVNNSAVVKALCVVKNGQKVCPTLPNTAITTSMISSTDFQCATNYVNTMQELTNSQTDRAKTMDVTIDTIVINDTNNYDNATEILRRMIKDETWSPDQLAYMATTTKGQQYSALNYDATAIKNIYQAISQNIRIKLTAQ